MEVEEEEEEGGCYGVGLLRAGDAQERLLL